jgi:hypothetical protein
MVSLAIVINPLTIAVALLVLEVVAPVVDGLTGRGYGLGIVSLLLIVCTILVAAAFTLTLQQAQQRPPAIHGLGAAMLLGAFTIIAFAITAALTLALLLDAVVVASIAGHRRWVAAILVLGLVSALVIVLLAQFSDSSAGLAGQKPALLGVLSHPEMIALFGIPQVAILIYSIVRSVHPVRPARQSPPLS